METYDWYSTIIRPPWAPPAEIFGPVWTILYTVIAITFGFVFYSYFKRQVSGRMILPFLLNLFFNFLFTPIQFGLQNNLLASLDILLVLGTLIWAMKSIYKKYRWVAVANIPYLAWVFFATILQFTITYLNL